MTRRASDDFSIQIAPSHERLLDLASTDRSNPFLTPEYANIRAGQGEVPLILQSDISGTPSQTIGFLRFGRTRRSLHIPSAPPVESDSSFWSAVADMRERTRLTEVSVDSFGSLHRAESPPSSFSNVIHRSEFLIRADDTELRLRVSSGHRRNINKAVRANAVVHERNDALACDIHAAVVHSALSRRRGRGEVIDFNPDPDLFSPLVLGGLGRIFQVELEGKVVASGLFLFAETGAYFHTGGTTDAGHSIGASPFLVCAVVDGFRGTSRTVLNLGGARTSETGLSQYKREFRSVPRELVSYRWDSSGLLRRVMNACTHHLPPIRAWS